MFYPKQKYTLIYPANAAISQVMVWMSEVDNKTPSELRSFPLQGS
jgi:hypothetical protein